jgi:hypothetical protein
MGFNIPVTSEQQDIIDSGNYAGRDWLLFTPFEIVLQARPASDSSASVITEIEYDNVVSGDYEDVREDMTVLLTTGTTTNDYKRPLWRGRITQLPTSDLLYINESSIALDVDLYITVLQTYEPAQRLRSFNLIDGWRTFEKLAPAIKGLYSSYVKEPDSGEAQFAFSPVGQAMEDGDSIDDDEAWLWEFSNTVTYDVGDDTTREITVTVPEGHTWATVKCTGANGVTGKFIFEIYVQDRYTGDYVYAGNEGVDITNDWDNGVNASVRYFEGVQDILDRWRCTVVTFESLRDGDPEFPNVSFVGYLRQDDNETRGDASYGTLKQRSYNIAGAAALGGEIKLSQLAINDTGTPAAWDDIELPNPARVIQHLGTRYAFFLELFSIDYGTIDNTWYGGDMDIESPFLLDACNQIADEINAQLIFAADGQIILRRNISLVTSTAERNAADVIAEIPSSRIKVLDYSHPHMDSLAQIVIGFRSYRTADGSSLAIRGTAPAVALGEGPDFDELPAQLLAANASEADARLEAGQRTANLMAYRDEGDEFTVELDGSYRFAQPSIHQWWHLIVAASETTNNIALTTADRLLLRSISHRFNPERGTRTLRATFRRETVGGLAMVLVEVIPASVPTAMPPRPPLPAYQGAFSPAGTLNYTSQTPGRTQPYSGRRYGSVSLPYSPAQQQRAGDAVPPLGCRVQSPPVNFRNPADVLTAFATVNGADYLITVRGSARISAGGWMEPVDFAPADGDFTAVESAGNPVAIYTPPWTRVYDNASLGISETRIEQTFADTTNFLSVRARVTSTSPTAQFYVYSSAGEEGVTPVGIVTNAWIQVNVNYTDDYLRLDLAPALITDTGDFVLTFHEIEVSGTGINPFTGTPGSGDLYGDAFYQWVVDEDGEAGAAELYPATRGLRLNSTPVAVPPEYNANHEYHILYTGDGNQLPVRFQDDDYADNENLILYMLICGENAGT